MVIASERREHRAVVEPAPRRPSAEEARALGLERTAAGQLIATSEGRRVPVRVYRCFPWSEPTRFVSLRDAEENEVALVSDPSQLDAGSRAALEIERIEDIEEEIEIRCWRVHTRQGPRAFQTPRDEWPREVPGGGLLIRDVAGDLFHIAAPDGLDRESQRHLWAFVD